MKGAIRQLYRDVADGVFAAGRQRLRSKEHSVTGSPRSGDNASRFRGVKTYVDDQNDALSRGDQLMNQQA